MVENILETTSDIVKINLITLYVNQNLRETQSAFIVNMSGFLCHNVSTILGAEK